MAQAPRGIRNNNPGNIRKSATQWEGTSAVQGDDAFVTFETPEHGIRAMARVLQTYRDKYGLDTVTKIISRWAPDVENDTAAYIKSVAAQIGVRPDTKLNPGQVPALIAAIIKHENGGNPYSAQQIVRGVQMASGEAPTFTDTTRPQVVQVEGGTVRETVPGPEYPQPEPIQQRRPQVVQVEPEPVPEVVTPAPAAPPKSMAAQLADAGGLGGAALAARMAVKVEEPGAVSPEPFRCATCGGSEPCLRNDCGHPHCTARGPASGSAVAHVNRPGLSGIAAIAGRRVPPKR